MFTRRPGRGALVRAGFAVALALLSAPGCDDEGSGAPVDVTGTYLLESVNEEALPAPIATGWTMEWGLLVLEADGTGTRWLRYSGAGRVELSRRPCTYTRDGGGVTAQFEGDPSPVTGSLTGAVMAFENGVGDVLAYRRGAEDVTGVYTLETLEGQALPALTSNGWLVEWGEIALDAAGNATWRDRHRWPGDPTASETNVSGTYALDGADVTLEILALGPASGIVGGAVLRLDRMQGTYVFRRSE